MDRKIIRLTILAMIAVSAVVAVGCGGSETKSKSAGTVIYGKGTSGSTGSTPRTSGMTRDELVAKAKREKQKAIDEYKKQASSQIENVKCPNTGKAKEVFSIGPGCAAAKKLIEKGKDDWATIPGHSVAVGRRFACMLAQKSPGVKSVICRSVSGVVKFNYPAN